LNKSKDIDNDPSDKVFAKIESFGKNIREICDQFEESDIEKNWEQQ
jgi:hypothetical protein